MTPDRAAAFFDVDGKLVDGNIVRYYADLRTQDMSAVAALLWKSAFLFRVPWLVFLDRLSRARFQRALYRGYRRFTPSELEARAQRYVAGHLQSRLYPQALSRIAEHAARGERIVLVTGSLRPLVAPLGERIGADAVLAAELEVRDGVHTGELRGAPLAGEGKARAMLEYIGSHGLEASACHAYADSIDDLPMLRSVGHAHVVDPTPGLGRTAKGAGWEILRWRIHSSLTNAKSR
jgi:HAD superfamily hydrolase (TIGR01490 family)